MATLVAILVTTVIVVSPFIGLFLVMPRLARTVAPYPRCGAVVAANIGRAVPGGLKFQVVQAAGAVMFLTAFLPFVFALMSVTGAATEAYSGPIWYLGWFALAAAMYLGGLKIVSRALRYPVKRCTRCGYSG